MREIKFRAWDGVVMYVPIIGKDGVPYRSLDDFNEENSASWDDVMQYTGLKDKNGKEIYEGDVVTWFVNDITRTAPVYYETGQACFWMGNDINGQGGLVLNDWGRGEFEIIGNIYENPELIEPTEQTQAE